MTAIINQIDNGFTIQIMPSYAQKQAGVKSGTFFCDSLQGCMAMMVACTDC